MNSTRRRILIVTSMLGVLIFVGTRIRASLGIELEVESVRQFAEGLGPMAPLLFVGVVGLRSFIAMPSQIVLIAAGLCFGTAMGAVVGGTGLLVSGLILYFSARYAGRAEVEEQLGSRFSKLFEASKGWRGGAVVAIGSGYPISPLSPIHLTAGLSAMPLFIFCVGAFAGGSFRAAVFSYFGNAMTESVGQELLLGIALIGAILVVPLSFGAGRDFIGRLFGQDSATEPGALPEPPNETQSPDSSSSNFD